MLRRVWYNCCLHTLLSTACICTTSHGGQFIIICQELQEFMTLSPKKIKQDMEESFIRVLIVILTEVSSAQIVVHDKRFNIVFSTERMMVNTAWQHGRVPVATTGPNSTCVCVCVCVCVCKDDKQVKQPSQESGIWVGPPKWSLWLCLGVMGSYFFSFKFRIMQYNTKKLF